MKLFIAVHRNGLIVPITPTTGPLLSALAEAVEVETDGYGRDCRYIPSNDNLTMEFVSDERLGERPGDVAELKRDAEQSTNRWLEEYRKHQDTLKKLKAAEEALAKAGITFGEAKQ